MRIFIFCGALERFRPLSWGFVFNADTSAWDAALNHDCFRPLSWGFVFNRSSPSRRTNTTTTAVFVPYRGDLFLMRRKSGSFGGAERRLVFVPYRGDLFLILYPRRPILPRSVEHFAARIAICVHKTFSFRELEPNFHNTMGIGGDSAFFINILYLGFHIVK